MKDFHMLLEIADSDIFECIAFVLFTNEGFKEDFDTLLKIADAGIFEITDTHVFRFVTIRFFVEKIFKRL